MDVGINCERLYQTSKLVSELAGKAPNRPLVGDQTYTLETGAAVIFYRHVWPGCPTVFFPVLPEVVGHPGPEVVLGKKSGIDAVEFMAARPGIEITKEQGREVVAR